MREPISRVTQVSKHVLRSVQDDQVTFLAASIAFYSILSIFPLMLLILAIGSYLGGEVFARWIVGMISGILTPDAEAVLEEALQADVGRGGASLLGTMFLIWSSLKVFRGLDVAFSRVYTQHPNPNFLETVRNALLVFTTIGVAVAILVGLRTYLRLIELPSMITYLSPILVFVTLVFVLYPMYYVFPGGREPFRTIFPGTVFAAAGWTLLGEIFGIYAANAETYALFGVIGGVLLLLMWFYFGAILILLGAVINAVLAGKYRTTAPVAVRALHSKTSKDQ